jgi:hypothetical protein
VRRVRRWGRGGEGQAEVRERCVWWYWHVGEFGCGREAPDGRRR